MPFESNTESSAAEFHRSRNCSKNAGCVFIKSEMNGLISIILVTKLGVLGVDVVLFCSQCHLADSWMVMVSVASNAK